MDPQVEVLEPAHWPAVSAIYAEGIATGQATFQRTVPTWDEWHSSHLADCRLVLRGDQILGWAALSPVSRREVYRGVAEVSIYIAAAARGKGLGRRLMAELVERSERAGIWTLQASIFPENSSSIALHRGAGFRIVGLRERLGLQGMRWRDVTLMERRSNIVGM